VHLKRLVSVVVSAAALASCVCLGTVGAAVQPRNATAFGNLGTPVPQPTSASSLPTILNAAAYEVITGPLDGEVIYADVFVHWVPVLVNGSAPTSYVVCTSDFLAPGFPYGGGCWSLTNTAFKVQGFPSLNGASVPSFEIYATTSDGVFDLGSITPNIINGWTGSNFGSETLTPQIGTITAAFAGGSLHLAWTHSSYGIADQYSIPSSYSIKV